MATLSDQKLFIECMLKQISENRESKLIESEAIHELTYGNKGNFNIEADMCVSNTDHVFERFILKKNSQCFDFEGWSGLHHNDKLERARMVGAACVKSGFIEGVSPQFDDGTGGFEGYKITEDRGYDLVFPSRYWLKYIPEVFPTSSNFVVAVLQGAFTACLTALLLYLMARAGISYIPSSI